MMVNFFGGVIVALLFAMWAPDYWEVVALIGVCFVQFVTLIVTWPRRP